MKCNISNLYTYCLYSLQQLRREVQPRRRCSRRAVDLGVHRLIPLAVLQLLLDVRRQGHFAKPLQYLQEDALVLKPHQPVAVRQLIHDLRRQLPVAEGYPCALPQLLAGPHQAFPNIVALVDEQQDLARTAARHTVSQQPGRQHPGVVQDQAVAGVQILRQVVKMTVLRLPCRLVQHQQPRTVPPLQRGLGDELRRQLKIEIMGLHTLSLIFSEFAHCGIL